MGVLSVILGFGVFFCLISVIIAVVLYVLYAIPLYQMAQDAGMENAWLAWIPIAQTYVLCMLAKNDFELYGQIRFSKRENAFWAYVILFVAEIFLSFIPFVPVLALIAIKVLIWKFNYDVINTYSNSSNALLISILGAIIPIVMTVELWTIRKNKADYTYVG